MDLNKLITELKEKAAKATPGPAWYSSVGHREDSGYYFAEFAKGPEHAAYWEPGPNGKKIFPSAKPDSEYINACSPDVILTLIEALEEAREALEFIAGRQSFRDLDETEKARAFLTKYFPRESV